MNNPGFYKFDPDNARILCNYSAGAYGVARHPEVGIFDAATDTHIRISAFGSDMIVAFRGTADVRNWFTDLDCAYDLEDNCRIHRGFARALDSVQGKICSEIFATGYKSKRIWLTGHSLGGALAMLFAWRFYTCYHEIPFSGVYTFGQPRVGDAAFRDLYDFGGLKARTFRVIHADDIVPRVPWLLGAYRHAGHEVFYVEPNKPLVDIGTLAKLPWDIRNAWRELTHEKIALFGDHHVATYQALFSPTNTGHKNREGGGSTPPSPGFPGDGSTHNHLLKKMKPSGAGPLVPGESSQSTAGSGASAQAHPATLYATGIQAEPGNN